MTTATYARANLGLVQCH